MKQHTSNFKNQIKELGRELDSIISYSINEDDFILTNEDLNSVTPSYEGNLLKSVMKQLDIDSNVAIPKGTVINYRFGVKVGENYEYLNFGNYIVISCEKQEDTNSYFILCYDKMHNSMKQNEDLGIVYPITIRNYINQLCNKLELDFANKNDNFVNYDKEINQELYVGLDYYYRDILDELAQVTASTICINENDELEIRYINETNDTIDEEFFKDVNVKFCQKYGPVNSIVLSRSAESDNVYLRDDESISANGLCEVKIIDNQIMNWNDRSDYLPGILEKLNGLEYYTNDFSSKGICYYDLCDRYSVSIKENVYPCIMLNDEINVTQGLEENIFTEVPQESRTDYTKADKTDKKVNSTYLIVDKMQQIIESLVQNVDGNTEQITQILQNITDIIMNVQKSGGNNLIKNSVGFAGTTEWDLTYDNEETSTVNTQASVELLENGTSGGAFILDGVKISQSIIVSPNTDYCLTCKIYKRPMGSGFLKVYNPSNENQIWLKEFSENELLNYEEIKFEGINISGNTLIVEVYGAEGSHMTVTDLMLNKGSLSTLWTQANGEILNTLVNINMNGVTVKSLQFDETGQYTVISPLEFAGYAKKNGVLSRVFTLNGDTTEVSKLRVEDMIAMPPIKIVPINGTEDDGWVIVADDGGNN